MKRRNVLMGLGAAGIGSILPAEKTRAVTRKIDEALLPTAADCVLIPQETEGPYPLDLSKNAAIFRQDVTEGRAGTPVNLVLTVVNVNDNCRPISNARIDIWHTDKEGVYSGYSQPGANTVGQTFMRGIQMTDSDGRVEFHTIYPGWYAGRITHIHFQVFLSSVLKATSQLAFPDSLNATVYASPLYATKGQNTSVANNAADMVFSSQAGDLQYELATVTPNADTGGYNASLRIGISAPASGLIDLEPETGGQFRLQQNYPNPFSGKTVISFSLVQSSQVELSIFDMSGRKVTDLLNRELPGGEHRIDWDGMAAATPVQSGNYFFQLKVENGLGVFTQAKVLTVVRSGE